MQTKNVCFALLLATVCCGGWVAASRADSEGDVTYGSQWWDQSAPEAKFREYTDPAKGPFLDSFLLRQWGKHDFFTVYGSNPVHKDQLVGLSVAHGAQWKFDLKYQGVPHLYSQIGRTPYAELQPGVFSLPDTIIQLANQRTPGKYPSVMQDLINNSRGVALDVQTNETKARLRGRPAEGCQFEISGLSRMRTGHKPLGAPLGFASAIELPEPIDQRTIEADASMTYARDQVKIVAGGGVSAFTNRIKATRWDNPKRLTDTTYASAYSPGDGTATAQMSTAPDNKMVYGQLSLGLDLPRDNMLTASLYYSQGTQDDPWLPQTLNTAILKATPSASVDSLPASSTGGKATNLTMDTRLTSSTVRGLRGTLRFREQKYDNKTPVHEFKGYVRMDQVWEAIPIESDPFGNKQTVLGADVDFDPMSAFELQGGDVLTSLHLSGTLEHQKREHTLREVESDAENAYMVRARASLFDNFSVEGRLRHAKRELDEFITEDYRDEKGVQVEQAGLRRFDVANRNQDLRNLNFAYEISDMFDVSLGYDYALNDYPDTRYGVTSQKDEQLTSEISCHPGEALDLVFGYSQGWIRNIQTSHESNNAAPVDTLPKNNWKADLRDRNDYAFLQANWKVVPKKLSIIADYGFSKDVSRYILSNGTGTAQDVPDTRYRRHDAQVEGRYWLKGDMEIVGRLGYQEFVAVDFAAKDIPLFQNGQGIYLGSGFQDYRVYRWALLATQHF